jgi:hypothetical protein
MKGVGKNAHLKKLENATENLKLFKTEDTATTRLTFALEHAFSTFNVPFIAGSITSTQNHDKRAHLLINHQETPSDFIEKFEDRHSYLRVRSCRGGNRTGNMKDSLASLNSRR